MELPKEFEESMRGLLKGDYENYLNSLNENAKKGLRVNQNYITIPSFKKIFNLPCKEIKGLNGCFTLEGKEKLGNTIFHHAGIIYIQEPSSMLAATCLEVKDGERALDLCSAPGGKGSQILEVNPSGVVVLNEINRARATTLLSNIERQGFKNAIVTSLSPLKLAELLPNYFDKILVDAPCSGEGMFRKDEKTILEWNKGLPMFNHKRQMEILESADKMLKEGGTMVYSTCTFNIIENEQTIHEFSKKFGYEIVKLPKAVLNLTTNGFELSDDKSTCLAGRCLPQNGFGEGQFVAKLIKKSQNNNKMTFKKPKNLEISKQNLKIAEDFVKENLSAGNFSYYSCNNNIYIYNNSLPSFLDGVVCLGVCLGKVEKGRLVVHHQFFKAYGKDFKNKLELTETDPRLSAYLKGNEIEASGLKAGYVCVLYNGIPLGGGKVSGGGVVKNLYPKGLRGEIYSQGGVSAK